MFMIVSSFQSIISWMIITGYTAILPLQQLANMNCSLVLPLVFVIQWHYLHNIT